MFCEKCKVEMEIYEPEHLPYRAVRRSIMGRPPQIIDCPEQVSAMFLCTVCLRMDQREIIPDPKVSEIHIITPVKRCQNV
jgi:hypothetical protein